jgi:hypothetical protein
MASSGDAGGPTPLCASPRCRARPRRDGRTRTVRCAREHREP